MWGFKFGKDDTFISTVAPCKEADAGNSDDDETKVSSGTGSAGADAETHAVLNLAVIASGYARQGHKRSRLKRNREGFALLDDQPSKQAAQAITNELDLADAAEDFSKADVIHSLKDDIFKSKIDKLIVAGINWPCSCAVEITNRAANNTGREVSAGNDTVDEFMRIQLTWDPTDEQLDEVDHLSDLKENIWNPCAPMQARIPGSIGDKIVRFEAGVYAYFLSPLLKDLDADNCARKLKLLAEAEIVVLQSTPSSLPDELQACAAGFVETSRAIRHTLDPLDTKFGNNVESVSTKAPNTDGGIWKGLQHTTWNLVKSLTHFQPLLGHVSNICIPFFLILGCPFV
jgi:hypothetical protein